MEGKEERKEKGLGGGRGLYRRSAVGARGGGRMVIVMTKLMESSGLAKGVVVVSVDWGWHVQYLLVLQRVGLG